MSWIIGSKLSESLEKLLRYGKVLSSGYLTAIAVKWLVMPSVSHLVGAWMGGPLVKASRVSQPVTAVDTSSGDLTFVISIASPNKIWIDESWFNFTYEHCGVRGGS